MFLGILGLQYFCDDACDIMTYKGKFYQNEKGKIMADISQEFREGINRWFEWENRLRDMSKFDMPKRYKAYNSNNEYDRFVGFIKEWAFERMKTAEKRPNPDNSAEIVGFD